jgi:predicted glycoside hydrolase/deacetylase ChbG (UPF0249 family)
MTEVSARRKVVIHADDVGMCHGANTAYLELSALGVCGSGSVMVPCPWFLEVAEAAADNPSVDLGVHLTLNAEKRYYKWRPLTAPPRSAGLTDGHGFFWADVATLRARAEPDAVEAELRAQIDAALAAGIDVTHLDDHMGAVMAPEFCRIYIRLGREYRLPILLTPSLTAYGPNHNLDGVDDQAYRACVEEARAAGFVIFDRVLETPWDRSVSADSVYRGMFSSIEAGSTLFALHFNAPGELEAIEPESKHIRIEEYELFRNDAFRSWLAGLDIEFCGMRDLRERSRASWNGGS